MKTKAEEFISSIINNEYRYASYDEALEALSETENETFDLIPRLSFMLAEAVETEQQADRAARYVSSLALMCFEINMIEADKEQFIE